MRWFPEKVVKGTPTTISSWLPGAHHNQLRLWKAEATEPSISEAFNVGDYYRAVDERSHGNHLQGALSQRRA